MSRWAFRCSALNPPPASEQPLATLSLKARALRLLAIREHSRAELQRKLLASALADARAENASDPQGEDVDEDRLAAAAEQRQAAVTQALDDLEQRGLLSDTRTADAVLLAKSPRYGSRRLKQLLQAKSLDASLVSDTLARARDSEFDRAHAVWQRRFGKPPADVRERARQQRFLAGRGFESTVIERVLKVAAQRGNRTDIGDD